MNVNNPCVYTGLVYLDIVNGRLMTGDLFYEFGRWSIRGVPTAPGDHRDRSHTKEHVVVETDDYAERPSGRYQDTIGDVKLLRVSAEFREHVSKWYPELRHLLPQQKGEQS